MSVEKSGSLAETGVSEVLVSNSGNVDISLAGTWAGTVTIQRRYGESTWRDVESYTENAEVLMNSAVARPVRLSFTRTSGTLEYNMETD